MRDRILTRLFIALGLLISTAGTAQADDQGYAFVLADQPTTDHYYVTGPRAYNGAAGTALITRTAIGAYDVRFQHMGDLGIGGHVQISAVGTTARACKVLNWSVETVRVRCFDPSGAPADSAFSALYLMPGPVADHAAFVWMDSPSIVSPYTPTHSYQRNGNRSDPIEITRTGQGRYVVHFPFFDSIGYGPSTALVTAYGAGATECQTRSWSNDSVFVDCYDTAGIPTDSQFTALFWRPDLADEGAAFAWADLPTTSSYNPATAYSVNPAGAPMLVERFGPGHYRVAWEGLDTVGVDFSNVQISAYGQTPASCHVESWTATDLAVRCWNRSGAPMDAQYTVFFLKTPNAEWGPDFAFAHATQPTNPSYDLTPHHEAWNPTRGGITVQRDSVGVYRVQFEAFDTIPGGGNVQVSAVSLTGSYCNTPLWYGHEAFVHCFNAFGVPADTGFTVLMVKAQPGEGSVGYVWADQPTATLYAPAPGWSHNPGGGAMSVERSAPGEYAVHWDGVFPAAGAPRTFNIQVTAYASAALCGWTGGNTVPALGRVTAFVSCKDASGAPVDTRFNTLLVIPEETDRAVGFAETVGGFLVPGMVFNSGDGMMTAADFGGGLTEVEFPGIEEQGRSGSHMQVTMRNPSGERCAVADFTVNATYTQCYDGSGASATPQHSVLLIRPTPAPEPGFALALVGGSLTLAVFGAKRARRQR